MIDEKRDFFMIRRLKSEIKQAVISNLKGYILICGVFLAGVILSYILNISSGLESEIKLYIDDFISAVKNCNADSNKTFSLAMLDYIKVSCVLFFMSLSVLGSVGTLIYVFIKGFSYGIVIISLFSILETRAVLFFLCLILPHSLVLAPCFSTYSLHCMKNAYSVSNGVKDIKARVVMPLIYGFFCVAFSSVAALIQAYIEPILTRIII